MNTYIYNLNAKRVATKVKLLEFDSKSIYFTNIDPYINEEHKTPNLLFCIKASEKLGDEYLKRKIDIINGILLLTSGTIGIHRNIELGELVEIISTEKILLTSSIEVNNLLSKIYNIIIENVELEEIFMYLGTDISFIGLYKITDILNILGIEENKQIKNLKHTANTSAIGAKSRHGLSKKTPPKNPMSADDGLITISKSIGEYFKEKYDIVIPLIEISDNSI